MTSILIIEDHADVANAVATHLTSAGYEVDVVHDAGSDFPVLILRTLFGARSADRVYFGDVEVRPRAHDVFRRGRPVRLRPKEFDLLMALLHRRGAVASRLELLREVWGYDADVVSRTVDTHVAVLRRKLEHDPAHPRHIVTVRKSGYRIALD